MYKRFKQLTMRIILILILALLVFNCTSKKQHETSNEQQEYYSEKYRPLFHFSPKEMWMNDPNGMVYYKGEYHLFYQHYPDSTVWGPMHWGHAVSSDLVHWKHLPIALYPDSLGLIFSGSAVVDWHNTSGFGTPENPPLVAIFTYHNMAGEKAGKNDFQTQGIAYSTDSGRTWTKYEGNPVLKNPGIRDFRDPKVVWHEETQKWIMALAVKDRVGFYSSANLKEWAHESEFGIDIGAHGGVWECPELFSINIKGGEEKKWVLLSSINPGSPNGGSATQYFVGEFDGHIFTTETKETKWLDWGKDNYAGVTWSDIPVSDGRRLFIGWMSNWQYATVVPTQKWRSALTFPRELQLLKNDTDYLLTSFPVKEIEKIRVEKKKIDNQIIDGKFEINHGFFASSVPLEMKLTFDLDNSTTENFGIVLNNEEGEYIRAGYNIKDRYFYIDRTNSGLSSFSKDFEGLHKMPFEVKNGEMDITLLYDASSVEFFAYNGEVTMTDIFFASKPYDYVGIFANNGTIQLKEGTIYKLKSIWEQK